MHVFVFLGSRYVNPVGEKDLVKTNPLPPSAVPSSNVMPPALGAPAAAIGAPIPAQVAPAPGMGAPKVMPPASGNSQELPSMPQPQEQVCITPTVWFSEWTLVDPGENLTYIC